MYGSVCECVGMDAASHPACEAVRVGALVGVLPFLGIALRGSSGAFRFCEFGSSWLLWSVTPRRGRRCADVCTAVALPLNLDANVMLCVQSSKFFQYSIRQIGRNGQKVAEMGN